MTSVKAVVGRGQIDVKASDDVKSDEEKRGLTLELKKSSCKDQEETVLTESSIRSPQLEFAGSNNNVCTIHFLTILLTSLDPKLSRLQQVKDSYSQRFTKCQGTFIASQAYKTPDLPTEKQGLIRELGAELLHKLGSAHWALRTVDSNSGHVHQPFSS